MFPRVLASNEKTLIYAPSEIKALRSIVKLFINEIHKEMPTLMAHQIRVAFYAAAVGEEMHLTDQEKENVFLAGFIHDLGKILIPQEILFKPTKLTAEEYTLIKTHTLEGYNLFIAGNMQFKHTEKQTLREIAKAILEISAIILQHHERIDGEGYFNFAGKEIKTEARIITVVDSFDAMIDPERKYREAIPWQSAIRELQKGRNRAYDEDILEAFKNIAHQDMFKKLNKYLLKLPEIINDEELVFHKLRELVA